MTTLLHGTAFITGTGSGIGRAITFSFAKYGVENLSISDINLQSLEETVSSLQAAYPKLQIEHYQLDVCDGKAVKAAVERTVERFGRLDIGVNVAGIGGYGRATHEEESIEDWEQVVDVDLAGVWRCQKAQLQAMLKQENLGIREGRGCIINISSLYGLVGPAPYVRATPYTASKHGVIGLTRADASSYAAEGIRINAICPGWVDTNIVSGMKASGLLENELKKIPMGRMALPEEIGDSIVYLASPLASYVTGSSLVVGGGYSAY
ncbi:short chain dehydrogenase/ reductase [Xylogone sp. PMI_703]|nr:short chain dehydrogenase/ reductase [Xylogone sp. PMI_703]